MVADAIPPPPPAPKSTIPPDPQAARMKSLANVIATTAALVGAFGALMKPTDNSATKAGYEQLAVSLKAISEENAKLHDDQVALRSYLDGYVKAQDQKSRDIADATVAVATAAPSAGARAKPPPQAVAAAAAPPSPAPPDPGPRPPVVQPPTFDQVVQKAAK